MTDEPLMTLDQRWCLTEFRQLLVDQAASAFSCRVALVAAGLTIDDVIAPLLASPFGETPIQVVYATTPLPTMTDEKVVLIFWDCANRPDLTKFLMEVPPGYGVVLVEHAEHLQAAADASNAELKQVAKTWMCFQLHGRLVFAPTISQLHGGVLPATRLASALLMHFAS